MRNYMLLPLLILTLAMSACAGKRKSTDMPDWVNGNSSAYPAEQFLIGRGQAEHAAVARDRARADLAKAFQVNIAEQSEDIVKYTRAASSSAAQTSLEASASRQIQTRTDQTLSHIDIAEVWQDPKTGQHHALAVLDRLKAGQALRQDIQQLDTLTSEAIRAARQQSELLAQIGNASRAVDTQLQRRALQRQLQVIDVTGMGVKPAHNLGALIQDRDQLLQRLRITTTVAEDPSGELASILKGAVTSAGFTQSSQADYLLEAQLQLSPFQQQGWYWYRGSLQITFKKLPEGENRGSHRWDIKESATQDALARKRMLDTLDKKLKAELRGVIIGFAQPE